MIPLHPHSCELIMEPRSKEIKCYSWSLHHKVAHILRNYFKNYNLSLPSHQAEYKVLIFHPRISSFPCRSRQVVLELTEQDSQTLGNVGCLWHWSSVQSRELIRLRKKETLRTEGNLFSALDSVGKYSKLSSVCVNVCRVHCETASFSLEPNKPLATQACAKPSLETQRWGIYQWKRSGESLREE